jgi:hypothetical protein
MATARSSPSAMPTRSRCRPIQPESGESPGVPDWYHLHRREVRERVARIAHALHDREPVLLVERVQVRQPAVEADLVRVVVGGPVQRQYVGERDVHERPDGVVDVAPCPTNNVAARDDGVEAVVAAAEEDDDEPVAQRGVRVDVGVRRAATEHDRQRVHAGDDAGALQQPPPGERRHLTSPASRGSSR